jgi:hypothetical protein
MGNIHQQFLHIFGCVVSKGGMTSISLREVKGVAATYQDGDERDQGQQ